MLKNIFVYEFNHVFYETIILILQKSKTNIMEDYTTLTVDGAEYFERMRAKDECDNDRDYDESEEDYDDDDDCNCSDPGCPCSGWKIGGL